VCANGSLHAKSLTSSVETHDRNKRSVVHVGNTEHRIAFREVTLVPKASGNVKGKERANPDSETFSANVQSLAATHIDRMTGLSAPAGRAPRKGKSVSVTPKASTSSRFPRRTSRRTSRVADDAGTQTMQIESSSPPRPTFDDDDDDSDDMYVDE
jgi:hypothetical protein